MGGCPRVACPSEGMGRRTALSTIGMASHRRLRIASSGKQSQRLLDLRSRRSASPLLTVN